MTLRCLTILLSGIWLGWAAGPAWTEVRPRLTVGMVPDTASFEDAGFNQSCKAGLQRAMRDFKVAGRFRESRRRADYLTNLNELAQSGCELVVGIGILMQPDLAEAAKKNPTVKFALIDGSFYPPLPNVQSIIFNVDEAAFQAGFLAAAWADFKDAQGGKIGYVGGVKVESVEQFIVSYQAGAAFFNKKYGKQVQVLGEYTGTFEDPGKGKLLGEQLLAQGVTVLFAAAGHTGTGALAAAQAKGRWGIGVDADQFYTLPAVKDCLLTSCLKKMDNAVYRLVQEVLCDRFRGGGVMTGTLANDQVGLAPFHSLDKQIPERIKKDLLNLQQDIQNGRLGTGWPPK
jgi:basic membrane protein A